MLTYFSKPFVFNRLNDIECYSLMSAIITLFSGALYLCNIGDFMKALSFSAIILVNLCFSFIWILNLLDIIFETNLGKLQHFFPFFTYSLVACIMAFQKTEKTCNLLVYLKNIRNKYNGIKQELIQVYETQDISARKGKINSKVPISKQKTKPYFVNHFK